jgi:hypothetical protein
MQGQDYDLPVQAWRLTADASIATLICHGLACWWLCRPPGYHHVHTSKAARLQGCGASTKHNNLDICASLWWPMHETFND